MSQRIVVASGYFDPLHFGHIEYLQKAKKQGTQLVVIVNNDLQAKNKKGFVMSPASERIKIVRELECVDFAVESVDEDSTVCKTLSALHPHVFANGGDQFNTNIPERSVCEKLGIELVDNLGGKIQSSRWIVTSLKKALGTQKVSDYLES